MIKRLFQNLSEREKIGSWSLNRKTKLSTIFFYLLVLFLPTQFGKHFWPDFAFVYGIRIDYLSPTIYLTDIFIVLIFLFFLLESIIGGKVFNLKAQISRNKIFSLLIFSLFLLLSLGIFFSKNQYVGIYGLVKFLEYIFLFSYTVNNLRKINVSVLLSCFVFGVAFESLLSIFQYLNQGAIGRIFYFFGERAFNSQTPGVANASIGGQLFLRPYGTFSHPNVLAGYLISTMLLIQVFVGKNFIRKQNLFSFSIFLLGSVAIILSMSRIVIIVWIATLVFLTTCNFWKKTRIAFTKKNNLALYVNKIILLLIISIFIFVTPLWSRLSQFSFSDQSVSQREQLINDSITMFKLSPVVGVGLNNFLVDLPIVQKSLGEESYLQPVHNIYLLVLAQSGFFVLTLCLLFLFKTYEKLKNKNTELYLLFFIVLFLGFFDHYFLTLQQGQILLVLIFGIFWSNSKNDAKIKE